MESLPAELVEGILRHLTLGQLIRVSWTSKLWRAVARNQPTFWRDIVMPDHTTPARVARFTAQIGQCDLSGINVQVSLSTSHYDTLERREQELQRLEHRLALLTLHLARMRSLSLVWQDGDGGLAAKIFSALSTPAPLLESLSIRCSIWTDSPIVIPPEIFAQHAPVLRNLFVSGLALPTHYVPALHGIKSYTLQWSAPRRPPIIAAEQFAQIPNVETLNLELYTIEPEQVVGLPESVQQLVLNARREASTVVFRQLAREATHRMRSIVMLQVPQVVDAARLIGELVSRNTPLQVSTIGRNPNRVVFREILRGAGTPREREFRFPNDTPGDELWNRVCREALFTSTVLSYIRSLHLTTALIAVRDHLCAPRALSACEELVLTMPSPTPAFRVDESPMSQYGTVRPFGLCHGVVKRITVQANYVDAALNGRALLRWLQLRLPDEILSHDASRMDLRVSGFRTVEDSEALSDHFNVTVV
ncbi:hypothetical protein BKA62DRAFT_715614 [Auriculariales sp. MPI-PUGE-AT-0066]|nr:hypothetical protein BKA62DRAFT_715614 [Auriculariales sp. MPI-PUGE-AT-0066]